MKKVEEPEIFGTLKPVKDCVFDFMHEPSMLLEVDSAGNMYITILMEYKDNDAVERRLVVKMLLCQVVALLSGKNRLFDKYLNMYIVDYNASSGKLIDAYHVTYDYLKSNYAKFLKEVKKLNTECEFDKIN